MKTLPKKKIKAVKGNEKDCICDKPNGKHKKHCDAFRLSEFLKQMASVKTPTTVVVGEKKEE